METASTFLNELETESPWDIAFLQKMKSPISNRYFSLMFNALLFTTVKPGKRVTSERMNDE